MNCVQAEEHFSAHLEDTLDYQTLQDFESHLTECEACQGEYARFQDSVNVVQQLPQIEPSPYFMSALQQRLATENSETDSVKDVVITQWEQLLDVFRRPKWAFSGVIALILAVAGTYFYQDLRPAPVAPTPRTEQIATSPEVFPVQQSGDRNRLLRGSVISTPTQPMQQRYMLKQVSYTTAATSGGL